MNLFSSRRAAPMSAVIFDQDALYTFAYSILNVIDAAKPGILFYSDTREDRCAW
jgi:hypothetical protein